MEIAVDSFFIVFVHQLDELGSPIAYRGDVRQKFHLPPCSKFRSRLTPWWRSKISVAANDGLASWLTFRESQIAGVEVWGQLQRAGQR